MKNIKVIIILALLIISLTAVWLYFDYQNKHYIVTDDARVDAMLVKAAPQISGKIIELSFEENDLVKANQIIGRLSDDALPVAANVDLTAIRSPISGQIIKKLATPGEMASPSGPVALLVNPEDIYITANIEEDKVERVKPGQKVQLTIDAFPEVYFTGQVAHIGSASTSTFSLLPTQSSGNTFIKVTQRVPVKISFKGQYQYKLLPGMNAVVKINL